MKKFSIPEGTRDLIPAECTAKRGLQQAIEHVFERYGYQELVTPSIEYYQTYQVGFEHVKDEQMYKFFDHNGRILTLRMDMTIPIARVAATKFKDHAGPLRFRYCANVYKVKEYFAGKRNEVSDCGIELLGLSDTQSDLEILVCALDVMAQMKQDSYTLEIGNINFFETACEAVRLNEEEKSQLADLIDRKSLSELRIYLETLALSKEAQIFFLQLPWLCGDADVLDEAIQYCFDSKLKGILQYLNDMHHDLCALGYHEHITFDLGKVPHLNYYSGLIFEGYLKDIGTSVLSGGRYDKLLAKFDAPQPAIGFSVKLDYVLPVLPIASKQQTIRLHYPAAKRIEALTKAKQLREHSCVELCCEERDDVFMEGV